jgi:hypothetical protein
MPEMTLPFGPSEITFDAPDGTEVVKPAAAGLEPIDDLRQGMLDALHNPLGSAPLPDLVGPGSKVTVAFDDPVKLTWGPIAEVSMSVTLEVLLTAGVAETDITLICANALHRKWTTPELATVIGADVAERFGDRLICHDAEDPDAMMSFGTTANGYPVRVHRLVRESDLLIYISRGYKRGLCGGWKSVCVGLSDWPSISASHTPGGLSMSLRNNHMHAMYDEMGAHLEPQLPQKIFKVEILQANQTEASAIWAGDTFETRAAAIERLSSKLPPRRSNDLPQADIVIYGVPDASGYAAFAGQNPILQLVSYGLGYLGGYIGARGKPGCSVIMATPCPDSWDMEHHPTHKEVWDRVLPESRDAYEITDRFGEEFAHHRKDIEQYRFGLAYHPVHALLAVHPLKRLKHAGTVSVAGAVDPSVPRWLGYDPYATVEDALSEAMRRHGPEARILVADYSAEPRLPTPLA